MDGFEKVRKTIEQQTALRGQSKSTWHNYLPRIAEVAVFNSLHNNGKMMIRVPEAPAERIKRLTGFDVRKCPACKQGTLNMV